MTEMHNIYPCTVYDRIEKLIAEHYDSLPLLIRKYLENMRNTVCPRSSDTFYIVSYYKKGSLFLGHTVRSQGLLASRR